ncbi:MAG: N-acylglucosamine 2-epimerase [Acholeplasmatales bacterium]|nr:MAG: N-acylglucosamine 2-epimerase [Acholeplasmatales bacterium]
MKTMLEAHLLEKIVPFWNAQVDRLHGGFYGYVDADLKTHEDADKGAVKLARLLYSYAALYNHYKKTEYLLYAKQAYDYIRTYLIDEEAGGVYWKTTYDGRPLRTEKHVYAQSFTLYALCEYYIATNDVAVKDEAKALFDVLEHHALERDTGAYWEQFDRHWRPVANSLLATDTLEPVYTTNVIIHMIEALTALYRIHPTPSVKRRLTGLLDWFAHTVYDPKRRACHVFFDADWSSMTDTVSYGHDIETSWLVDEALDVLGLNDHPCRLMSHAMLKTCHEEGFSEGWLLSERNGSVLDTAMIWWVQAEAMVGFLNGFQRTGNPAYYAALQATVSVTLKHIVDPREGGEWFWAVCRKTHDPLPELGISENWKANYHNIRALLKLMHAKEVPA